MMMDNPIFMEAADAFRNEGFVIEERPSGSMIWVRIPGGRWYSYYPTTCRWAPMANNSYPKKHYRSKSVYDFIDRFLKPSIPEEYKHEDSTD